MAADNTSIEQLDAQEKQIFNDVVVLRRQQSDIIDSINREKLNEEQVIADLKSVNKQYQDSLVLMNNLLSSIDNTNKIISKLTSDKKDLQLEIKLSKEDLSISQSNLDVANNALVTFLRDAEVKKNNAEKIYTDLILSSQTQLDSIKNDISIIEVKIKDNNDIIKSQEEVINSYEGKINTLNDLINNANKSFNSLNNSIVTKIADLDDINNNIKSANTKLEFVNNEISSDKVVLLDITKQIDNIKLKQKDEKSKLDLILVKGANIIARDEYLKQQEIYIEDSYKKIGLTYQPYAGY